MWKQIKTLPNFDTKSLCLPIYFFLGMVLALSEGPGTPKRLVKRDFVAPVYTLILALSYPQSVYILPWLTPFQTAQSQTPSHLRTKLGPCHRRNCPKLSKVIDLTFGKFYKLLKRRSNMKQSWAQLYTLKLKCAEDIPKLPKNAPGSEQSFRKSSKLYHSCRKLH